MNKKPVLLAAILLLSMSLLACSSSQTQTGDENKAVGAPADDNSNGENTNVAGSSEGTIAEKSEVISISPLTDYVSEEGYEKAAAWKSCDDTALAAVMRKAMRGEKVVISCIGGSITQGTISSGQIDGEVPFRRPYADIYREWWESTFPEAQVEFINAGIGATDSYIGVHRVQKDVLDYDPDLVLVEFSVNDSNSNASKTSYDNLVRRILNADNNPAVMLLFMGQTNGANAQEQHVLVGFNYNLPMISYANYISYAMKKNLYTDKQLSSDAVHPSALGHAITGELIWKYLNNVYENIDAYGEPTEFSAKPVTKDFYLDSEILGNADIEPKEYGSFEKSTRFSVFPNDWSTESGEGNIIFEIECSRLGVMYLKTTDGKSGQFEVYVDGELATSLNADFSGGWGDYADAQSVYSGESGVHVVEIKKAENSENQGFTILGLMVAR